MLEGYNGVENLKCKIVRTNFHTDLLVLKINILVVSNSPNEHCT